MGIEARRKLKEAMINEAIDKHANINEYLSLDNTKRAGIHLYDIEKDFRDSTKRYKSVKHRRRDMLQPFTGVYNFIRGMGQVFLFPIASFFLFLAGPCFLVLMRQSSEKELKKSTKEIANVTLGVMADGAAQILLGAVRILKTPFTWLVQIPLRSILTHKKGWQPLSENAGTVALKTKYQNLLQETSNRPSTNDVLEILFRIEEKYKRSCYGFNAQTNPLDKVSAQKYIQLEEAAKNLIGSLPKYYSEHEKQLNPQPNLRFARRYRNFYCSKPILFQARINEDVRTDEILDSQAIEYANNIVNGL